MWRAGPFVALAAMFTARAVAAEEVDHPKTSLKPVPLFGGNTDQGFGGGGLVTLTREAPGKKPFKWNLSLSALVTFRGDDGFKPGYQDYILGLVVPELKENKRLRIEARLEFTNEVLWWYGVGNASRFEPTWEAFDKDTQKDQYQAARRYWQYTRTWQQLFVLVRARLGGHFYFEQKHALTHNDLGADPGSLVDRDVHRNTDTAVRNRLVGLDEHWSYVFEHALAYDTRDDEIDTKRGVWISSGPRFAPGGAEPFPYPYGGAVVNARVYLPVLGDHLTLAMRVVGDALYGHTIPFYELQRWSEGYALGGTLGVRGVPAQRYAGRLKAFGNFELRARVATFSLFGSKAKLGMAAFFDAGRVWSDWEPHPELDASGLGLKYGVGGGLRFAWGEGLFVRLDVAWSPDARPIGVYFAPGQLF